MGILMSRAHDAWAWAQSSTLKGDLRYTPTTVFATFPLPAPLDFTLTELNWEIVQGERSYDPFSNSTMLS